MCVYIQCKNKVKTVDLCDYGNQGVCGSDIEIDIEDGNVKED